ETFSTHVIESKSVECWKTIAHFFRTGYIASSSLVEISSPSSQICPLSGDSKPTSCLMRTLLPTPEAPMMKSTSPSWTSKLTSDRTAFDPNALEMFLNAIKGPSRASPLEGRSGSRRPGSLDDLGVLDAVELRKGRVEVRVALRLDAALIGAHPARSAFAVALEQRVDDVHPLGDLGEGSEAHAVEPHVRVGVVDE